MNNIYKDFPKDNYIWNVSHPEIVRYKYEKLYKPSDKRSQIYLSSRKNKKYMVFDGYKMVHFGDIRYQDFTKSNDLDKRSNYHKRFNKPDNNPYSPYNLSRNLLW